MQTDKLRNMLYLQWTKTNELRNGFLILIFCFLAFSSFAQKELYQEEHDAKPYYFGITLGLNKASFHTDLHPVFLEEDTIMIAEPLNTGGFSLGLSVTAKLNNRFELRFNPQLMFTERNIAYRLKYYDRD